MMWALFAVGALIVIFGIHQLERSKTNEEGKRAALISTVGMVIMFAGYAGIWP
ncbi:hypothetical protein [Rhizobium sp. SSA_523]|uniref:hypothetical protein n=1 Tax=Rhizobium sp. SSA_523 TaxID=2952477 RepID=UPI0020912A34|nr:hypothetical protein [Rhizobium sp. SSA_523]MCO5730149.1 hypothetical protein [Rhizobium sp. SSA_523]WKC25214.1 hypothetical protein QTJ18_14605 [Rhizobium sp. SSA_523]